MVLTEANLLSARGGQHAGLVPTPEPDLFCLDVALLPPLRPSGQRLSCFPKALLGGKCLEVRLNVQDPHPFWIPAAFGTKGSKVTS